MKKQPSARPNKHNKRVEAFLKRFPEWKGRLDLIFYPPDRQESLETYPELRGDLVLQTAHDMTSYGVARISLYFLQRERGVPHKLAAMVASQRGPRVNTDDTFFGPMKPLSEQFASKRELKQIVAMARRHGYNPNMNDVYVPQLARFRGDPEGFVSRTTGRSRIRQLCEQRGSALEYEGSDTALSAQYRPPDVDPYETAPKMAEDLVRKYSKQMIKKDPSLKRKKRSELREIVIAKHGPIS